jgi:hypothetical protein
MDDYFCVTIRIFEEFLFPADNAMQALQPDDSDLPSVDEKSLGQRSNSSAGTSGVVI